MTREEYDAAVATVLAKLLVAAYQKENPEPRRATVAPGEANAAGRAAGDGFQVTTTP